MAVKTTRWSPDTCDCVIEYQWDDAVAVVARTHTVSRIVTACAAHQGLAPGPHFATVGDENTRKNKVYIAALANLAAVVETFTTDDGSVAQRLKAANRFSFSYDANRLLTVSIAGLTNAQKNTLQTAVDAQVGAGKVKVV